MNHFKLHIKNSQQRSYPCRSIELLGNETNLGAHDRKFESAQQMARNQGSHFNAKYALYISQCQFENDIIFIFLKYVKMFWH